MDASDPIIHQKALVATGAVHIWVPAFAGTTMEGSLILPNHGAADPLRIGIGGPVGSGKTALMDLLARRCGSDYEIAAITNDIYTKWDAEFLVRSGR